MNVADLIVEFFIQKGITDVFGYPGGMVIHLINSLEKYKDKITNHINYHEQASAFSAIGYAMASQHIGVAYATSGPGATNLITGIANAYFDSIPSIFITGNVNIKESKGNLPLRQRGFQEADIVSLVKKCTKYAKYIDNKNDILYELQKAYHLATSGRFAPVLLDIPMNIFKEEIDCSLFRQYKINATSKQNLKLDEVLDLLKKSKRPCIIAGLGINRYKKDCLKWFEILQIPIITSMPNVDLLPKNHHLNFGFLGAYGHRCANFIVHKSDLVLSLGSRLDIRQIGANKDNFAPNAKLIRVDIDKNEFSLKVKKDELQIQSDGRVFLENLILKINQFHINLANPKWLNVCNEIKKLLKKQDSIKEVRFINSLSKAIPNNAIITTDVGQSQVWVAQSFHIKTNQRILFSASFGAMGCSLPMAIGAYFGSKFKNIYCISGDGGFQMNMQELEFIKREKIPLKIIIINNKSLGMIRHFQEIYFDKKYIATTQDSGYLVPDFEKIAKAYDLRYIKITHINEITKDIFIQDSCASSDFGAVIVEVVLDFETYVSPKLEFNKPNCDQLPLLDRKLINYLLSL